MVSAIFWLLGEVIRLMIYALVASAVLSMLIAFGVANPRNRFVYAAEDFLTRVTDPLLRPIRRIIPYFGNVDLSPLIAILLLEALQIALADIFVHLEMSGLAL